MECLFIQNIDTCFVHEPEKENDVGGREGVRKQGREGGREGGEMNRSVREG